MLYNIKQDLTKEALTMWLETQPPEKEYNWGASTWEDGCLLLQYMKAKGIPQEYYPRMQDIAYDIAHSEPWTFGAALERARKTL